MKLSLNSKLAILGVLCLISITTYQFLFINLEFWSFIMHLRLPKLSAMLIAAFCIGFSSLIFQTIINNKIVTPCLLGMNALYVLIHVVLVFIFGMSTFVISNAKLAFICDLIIMAITASLIYGYIFKKVKYNVLYVLLIGTVLTTLCNSMNNSIIRAMDPNDYDTLLATLTASFSNINHEIIIFSVILCCSLIYIFRHDLKLLDVMILGKDNAISLGIDYDHTLKRLLLCVTLFIAIATALVGPISFMGLLTTNIARSLFKTYKHRYLLLASALIAILILITGQLIVEHIFTYSIPVSVFITLGGGMYFLYIVLHQSKGSI